MNAYDTSDTIAAIASPPGGAARAIVRVSGPQTVAVLSQCFCGPPLEDIESPSVVGGAMFAGKRLGSIPCDLYLWPGERSYTRQLSAEIHTIGSPPLVAAVLRTICECGARLAQPGEFTLRAFLAGRIDLTQAEAVLGVIDAHGQAELAAALAQLAGGLGGRVARLRSDLLDLLADLEAGLDFVDEEIEFIDHPALAGRLGAARADVLGLAEQLRLRDDGAQAPRVVLVGEPNAGKSRLFNALSQGDHAIVSEQAGTTRDYLVRRIECGGMTCLLHDTAGVEDVLADSGPEQQAQAMAQREQATADLLVVCLDSTRPLTERERRWIDSRELSTGKSIFAHTKCDAAPAPWRLDRGAPFAIRTSAALGTGLDELRSAIAAALSKSGQPTAVASTAIRCRESVALALASLERAIAAAERSLGDELIAAELRAALYELGQVAGAVYTDDLLDRIFSRFCIGK
jgi:tRNA modification GTPase